MVMKVDETAKRFMFNETEGIRKQGRHKLLWFDGVTNDLATMGRKELKKESPGERSQCPARAVELK